MNFTINCSDCILVVDLTCVMQSKYNGTLKDLLECANQDEKELTVKSTAMFFLLMLEYYKTGTLGNTSIISVDEWNASVDYWNILTPEIQINQLQTRYYQYFTDMCFINGTVQCGTGLYVRPATQDYPTLFKVTGKIYQPYLDNNHVYIIVGVAGDNFNFLYHLQLPHPPETPLHCWSSSFGKPFKALEDCSKSQRVYVKDTINNFLAVYKKNRDPKLESAFFAQFQM